MPLTFSVVNSLQLDSGGLCDSTVTNRVQKTHCVVLKPRSEKMTKHPLWLGSSQGPRLPF